MTSTTCPKCQGVGWLPSRTHRFYSDNGRLCPCGMHATVADAGRFADELRQWVDAVQVAERQAERRAARAARRAARSAA